MGKNLILVLMVVIGIIVGVVIVKQQTQMLQAQERIENKFVSNAENANTSGLEAKVQDIDRRITAIENMIKGAGGAQQAQRQGPLPEDYTKVYDIPADHSPVRGDPNAPVTIVAFDDYQCPFCARFHAPILEVLKAYPDKVNFIIKNFPLQFHPQAIPAAKAVLAAGEQGKYFEMADALLADNKDLSEERFNKEAEKLGLDVERFVKDYSDPRWQDIIQKDLALGQKVGVQGTPTFFINGHKAQARDLNGWKTEIDKILNDLK